jgi:hypothetical protein
MMKNTALILSSLGFMSVLSAGLAAADSWQCQICPNESAETVDAETGATVLFVTTKESNDLNLYFHDRSWLADESMLVFTSDRDGKQEPFGYIEETREIARLAPGDGIDTQGWTAGKQTNSLYLISRHAVCEWQIRLSSEGPSREKKASVTVSERKICDLPPDVSPVSALNENADATRLSLAFKYPNSERRDIVLIEKNTGEMHPVATVEWPVSHLQCSWTQPDLVMFARGGYPQGDRVPLVSEQEYATTEPHARIWLADLSGRPPWPLHFQCPGELVTHECWWVDNLLTFCGGYLPEESHVKVADVRTGIIRILGAGSWWPNGTSAQLAKRNWWHASGSSTGAWVAADNWHGDIVLFDARTTRMCPLTFGHRTYGGGAHPHVGWAPQDDRVVFTSNKRGNPDVCIAYIPEKWRKVRDR